MIKKVFILMVIMIASFVIFTACAQDDTTNQPVDDQEGDIEQDVQPADETNLSPTPEEMNETHTVVLYFSDNDLTATYRINKDVFVRNKDHLAKAALEAWIDGPEHEELTGLVNTNVIVEYVEELDGIANVSFSKEIQGINLGSSGELMFAEQIAMILQQFGFDRTQILVEGRVGETLLGHLYTGEPIIANDPESYLWVEEKDSREIVLQNVAFRIFEPYPNSEVKDQIVVRGLARVYEGTLLYEFEDGHFILDEGFTTATEGAPGWGEFEIIIELDEFANYSGRVILFEESAKDGSRINELKIPVNVIN
ncbi:MAG: Gmad2 immunoglobulin-like domain-containing protein [Anaerobacillus sp.]|uniref:Gmad2 immunoglobulin-like domain-containing protein n=1 Tax=Anaerobacillus sp. TaxID=1872506 RepID=UPI003919FF0C